MWNDNPELPIYERGRRSRYAVQEVMSILLANHKETPKCTMHPLKVRENLAFVIDLEKYDHWEDIKSDMNGVYNGILKCGVWTVEIATAAEEEMRIIARKEVPLKSDHQFHLVTNSKKNKAEPSLVRSIFLLRNKNGDIVNNVCLLQYHILDAGVEKVDFSVQAHGNAKSAFTKSFFPSSKSTLEEMRKGLQGQTSGSSVYSALMRNAGGANSARTASDLPRSRQQIYNAKSRIAVGSADPVSDLLVYARDKDDELVMNHTDFPVDTWVLGTKVMRSDLVRFTTSEGLRRPFSVDPTFNMGQFEVTPIVYQNLMLTSKRTNHHPVFLGPTMIHHQKDYGTYKTLSSTCVSKCRGFIDAKGFITDGETALQRAFEDDLSDATALRCFRHFEGNCREQLKKIGIKDRSNQAYFIEKTFGVKGKMQGILDAEDKRDLKERLRTAKTEMDDRERNILNKTCQSYVPRYSAFLEKKYDMMKKWMIGKARREAGLPVDETGKPERAYTNTSECMNNMMKAEKSSFLRDNPGVSKLSKLQFTRHVFESIHERQQEELKMAIAGLSEEYEMSPHASHLQVPADVWFDWAEQNRHTYTRKVNELTAEDILNCKEVPWPTAEIQAMENDIEFQEPSVNVAQVLQMQFGYSSENASFLGNEVNKLLNHPNAIQQKPSLEIDNDGEFEVASKQSKTGRVHVRVYSDHTRCSCGRYKHDWICSHSLAVATRAKIIEEHFAFLSKKRKTTNRSALAENAVNHEVAGKKGGRNKFQYRSRNRDSDRREPAASPQAYTEIYHNDHPFTLQMLSSEHKKCKSCDTDFCHKRRIIPFDLVLSHPERWYYPVNGDWSNKRATAKETTRYYHASKACILKRFPYFNAEDYIQIPPDVAVLLKDSHKMYLSAEFGLSVIP